MDQNINWDAPYQPWAKAEEWWILYSILPLIMREDGSHYLNLLKESRLVVSEINYLLLIAAIQKAGLG